MPTFIEEHVGYAVPTYQAAENTDWYHFLHGNVPGHQIDFIFRPNIPQGALTRQHFSHLTRLMRYIEPRHESTYAFTIGNLSRDDTQYEAGHGGLALIFGLRVHGAIDHAGRQDPPFCHAVVCVDRHLEAPTIYEAALRFQDQLLYQPHTRTDGTRWYQSYVINAQHMPQSALAEMYAYVGAFNALPALGPSDLGLRWTGEGANVPRRVVIVYPDRTPFAVLAEHMSRIAGVLVESDIRWTAISTGREQDLSGGTTVRFVPEREAVQEPEDVVLLPLDQVPIEPRDIATQLFGAEELRLSQTNRLKLKWRRMGDPEPMPEDELTRPWAKAFEELPAQEQEKPMDVEPAAESSGGVSRSHTDPDVVRKRRRGVVPMFVGLAILVVGLSVIGMSWIASRTTPHEPPPSATHPVLSPEVSITRPRLVEPLIPFHS
ncbi:MAG TPA: hypothetical protein PK156_11870, partial [Polyangium sp.]|nr:hypothetical protein [Polyangium sp.]